MISLYVDNGVAYVWNSKDWNTLRTRHRICGSLIGSAPSFPRQNDFLGLPMALMSEEARLLVEQGSCELISLPNIIEKPSEADKNKIEESKAKICEEQINALRRKRIDQLSQKIDIIVAGKRQKLLSKGITDAHLDKETLLQEEINKLATLQPAHVLMHLPTEHLMDTDRITLSTRDLSPDVHNGNGSILYMIFKDLWHRGHHITSGSKFGCDFLAYPGDPVKFHATYMIRCVYDHKQLFRPANLVAFGRLSVAVNKLAVLAFCNSSGEIEYQTLKWHDSGIGK